MEPDREERRNKREVQKIKALKADAAKKAQAQKKAAETAGPGPNCIGPGSGRESDTATGYHRGRAGCGRTGNSGRTGSGKYVHHHRMH